MENRVLLREGERAGRPDSWGCPCNGGGTRLAPRVCVNVRWVACVARDAWGPGPTKPQDVGFGMAKGYNIVAVFL